ncbi:hypothetical protein ABT390_05490 [Streptomyces aurantiacus]|uniref:Uncharacterized protein n=1 Tax=Streptomyces aurantiacus JA 4570 TaxID=1286094 RepID=S4ADR4_9ACTN|nr:hypothetical protein [Streptomyces aurantiacus]EPH39572.1 hypothetical protein STRAU_7376 [Streptomyces aurantiacus JA 4570]
MDVHELRAALRAAGVPDGYYWIEGVHEPAPTPPDFAYLRKDRDGAWETGTYERGQHHALGRDTDEAEGCARLLRLLSGRSLP